ncbi:MAG: hypothetical protein U0872_14720 [Planctomycetaceae bacterium]
MNRLSIRLRMTIWYAASLIAFLILFGGLIDALMHQLLLSRTDFELEEELEELVLEIELAENCAQLMQQLDLRFSDHPAFEFQVTTAEGEPIFTSRGIRSTSVPLPVDANSLRPEFQRVRSLELGDTRTVARRVMSSIGPLSVVVAASLHRHLAEFAICARMMLRWAPPTLMSLAGGILARRHAVASDRQDEETCGSHHVAAQNMNERLSVLIRRMN